MECSQCKVKMSPLYLPVQTRSIYFGIGTTLEKASAGIENPYDFSDNFITGERMYRVCSGNLYVCPKCGVVRMKIPERILDDEATQGMTTKQRKQYHKEQELHKSE